MFYTYKNNISIFQWCMFVVPRVGFHDSSFFRMYTVGSTFRGKHQTPAITNVGTLGLFV